MSLLHQIERRCGNWGIPGLLRMVAILQVVVYVIMLAKPDFGNMLTLSIEPIMEKGEAWRVLSFCVLPAGQSIISLIFSVLLLFWAGDALEAGWGEIPSESLFFQHGGHDRDGRGGVSTAWDVRSDVIISANFPGVCHYVSQCHP